MASNVAAARPGNRWPKVTTGAGAVLIGGALIWWLFAVPALVKYPTDLDVTPRYEGTFQLFADPETFAPLAEPIEVPLTIERHIRSAGDESGSSRVVVEETIRTTAGTLPEGTQSNVYVMDRRDMDNVADDRGYAFTPENVVDRSDTYRLQLPFDTDDEATYAIWDNDIGATYELVGSGESYEAEGLTLAVFNAELEFTAVDPAYLADLQQSVPLPEDLTLDQLAPFLLTLGIDVEALITGLTPLLSPQDLQALGAAASQPIPLVYVTAFSGSVGIEPDTGSEVDIREVNQSIAVRPDLTALAPLAGVLANYASVPAVAEALGAFAAFTTADPIAVVEYTYAQTPASVADIASEVKDMRSQIQLAERWVPGALLVVGTIVLLAGLYLWWRRSKSVSATVPATDHEKVLVAARR